jgi:rubredoxin
MSSESENAANVKPLESIHVKESDFEGCVHEEHLPDGSAAGGAGTAFRVVPVEWKGRSWMSQMLYWRCPECDKLYTAKKTPTVVEEQAGEGRTL